MKYVVYKYKDLKIPVLMPDCATHAQVGMRGAKPISAGFVRFDAAGLAHVFDESASLKLKPAEGDNRLIDKMMMNMGTAAFLDI